MNFTDLISIINDNTKEYLYQDILSRVIFLKSTRFENKLKYHNFSDILSEKIILIYMNYLPGITNRMSVQIRHNGEEVTTYAIKKVIEYKSKSLEIYAVHNE